MKKRTRTPMAVTAVRDVLPFIKQFMDTWGTAPTYEEIAEKFGRTKPWANLILNILIKKKLIRRKPYSYRGITLTQVK